MTTEEVYAELGEIVNGSKPGREDHEELIVVDLTGTGAQDAAIGQVCIDSMTSYFKGFIVPNSMLTILIIASSLFTPTPRHSY